MQRMVMFIDFNSYFASVEQHAQPHLRGRPVAVVPVMTDHTSCIAASVEAKKHGIKTGTKVMEARARCPGLNLVLTNAERYMAYHRRLVKLLELLIPVEKVMSIDELYAVFTGAYAQKNRMEVMAMQVKQLLMTNFGPSLTCSIGLAPTVFLAKVASDMQKPDGLVYLDSQQPCEQFFELELRDLSGIGPRMERRFRDAGIRSVAQLWKMTPQALIKIWGGIEGLRFWQALHGIEPERPATVTRQVGHSKVLSPDLRHEQGAREVLDRLVYRAALRLRKMGYECAEMHLFVKFKHVDSPAIMRDAGLDLGQAVPSKMRNWKMCERFASTQETCELLRIWRSLWLLRPQPFGSPLAVGVVLCQLQYAGAPRLPLFAASPRERALGNLLDQIALKHGSKAIWFASAQQAVHEEMTRIAFQHLPDV